MIYEILEQLGEILSDEYKEVLNKMAPHLKSASQNILSSVILVLRTALKNKKLGDEIPQTLQPCIQSFQTNCDKWAKKKDDQVILLKIFWCVVLIRQYARQVFLGSIISDAIDGGDSLKNLVEALKYFVKFIYVEDDQNVNRLFEKMVKISQVQSSQDYRNLIKEAFKNPNNMDAVKKVVEEAGFDSTLEFFKKDIAQFKTIGLQDNLFATTNDQDSKTYGLISYPVAHKSYTRLNLNVIEDGFDVGKSKVEVLSIFQGRTSITLDEFLFNFVELYYIKQRSTEIVDLVFVKLQELQKADLDLNDEDDRKEISEILKLLLNKPKADFNYSKDKILMKESKGAINGIGWEFDQVVKAVAKVKCSPKGQQNPQLKLKTIQIPNDLDPKAFSDLGLKGHTFLGQAGQWFWSVGSSFLNDIILPKMRYTIGTQFVILQEKGEYQIKDMSSFGRSYETMLRAVKGKDVPIKENDLITLGQVVEVKLSQLSASGITLEFLQEHQPSNVQYEKTELEIEFDQEDEKEVNVGRSQDSDITIGHEKVSNLHCVIKLKSIVDKSIFGTFKHLRDADQDDEGRQSSFIPLDKNLWLISLGSYDFQVL